MYQLLQKLIKKSGVSGREMPIREKISELIAPFVNESRTDAMGNLICLKKGNAENPRKIMLCAHMDEIGFIVNYIEKNGWIRVAPVGGIHTVAASFAPVVFENGVKGVLIPESCKDIPKPEKCFADIGASNAANAKKKVKIGDTLALASSLTKLAGKRVAGRPLDNRIGCAVLLEIAQKLQNQPDDIYFVFSVQEEVGLRGAGPAAFGICPDLALIYDVTATGDTPGCDRMAVKLGNGAAIKLKDSSVICHGEVVEGLSAVAEKEKIKVQYEVLTAGGTDTSAVQMTAGGCRAGAISIPCRYIHTAVETLDLGDAEAAVKLTLAYLKG